jgi:hypothetical protein
MSSDGKLLNAGIVLTTLLEIGSAGSPGMFTPRYIRQLLAHVARSLTIVCTLCRGSARFLTEWPPGMEDDNKYLKSIHHLSILYYTIPDSTQRNTVPTREPRCHSYVKRL